MGILSLFDTTGAVFGPAILIAGLIALCLCLRASLTSRPAGALRLAVVVSLAPLALGVCAVLFGLAVLGSTGQLAGIQGENWLALGKACLAGLVVTVPPLVWSLALLRLRRGGT